MDAQKKQIVGSRLTDILNEIPWNDAAKGAALMGIDWVQAWLLPGFRKVAPAVAPFIEYGLQVIEDNLRGKAAPQPTPAPSPAPKPATPTK
jgi:hypothetical protein